MLGAPEVLAGRCPEAERIEQQVETWATKGQRVLLFAVGPASRSRSADDPELPSELRPLCLVILSEEIFGWLKTVGGGRKLRYIGVKPNRLWVEFTAAGYNLVRMVRIEHQQAIEAA